MKLEYEKMYVPYSKAHNKYRFVLNDGSKIINVFNRDIIYHLKIDSDQFSDVCETLNGTLHTVYDQEYYYFLNEEEIEAAITMINLILNK